MLKKIKSKLLTKWFKEWVKDEFDIQTLDIAASMIQEQKVMILTMQDLKTNHTIKGFGK